MYILHEGEIMLKETYGTTSQERFYVKPPEQQNIVVLDQGKPINAYTWFYRIFLPHGYPHSVSKDYTAYQIWDTAQAFCSTITGTLATQEVLRGVGVGDTTATPLAATIVWVIKDGCGHIGRILFACTHGTQLDAYSKKWRLYADVLNDAAMCIEISLPLFRNYTTFALCVSTTMKAIVGVAGGATRAALTQHHAVRGNLADVSAKDAAQETAVNLIASITALALITLFGNSVTLFLLMMVLHISFNYLAVRAVCLRTLNEPRFLQVISSYVKHEVIPSPCEVNRNEPIVFYQLGNNTLDLGLFGFRIKLGYSVKDVARAKSGFQYLRNINNVYSERNYLLYPNVGERQMLVVLRERAGAADTLCAYFHAALLAAVLCAINDRPLATYQNADDMRPFAKVCQTLQAADWSREPCETVGFSGFVYEPSFELMQFVDKVVQKEWLIFKAGLKQVESDAEWGAESAARHASLLHDLNTPHHTLNTPLPYNNLRLSLHGKVNGPSTARGIWGLADFTHTIAGWDVSKHLLLAGEWRVSSHTIEPKEMRLPKEDENCEYIGDDLAEYQQCMTQSEDQKDTFIIEPSPPPETAQFSPIAVASESDLDSH